MWSMYDGPLTLNREGMWDIVTYAHHGFGEKAKKKQPYPYSCKDEPEIGPSPEASCLWDAIPVCVASLSKSTNGNTSLHFQACMENSKGPHPHYVPYAWLDPPNSKKGHKPYRPSKFTLGCLANHTDVSAEALGSCLGLDGQKDAFIGSTGHQLLMKEYAFSDETFKKAGQEEAGPSIFIDGKYAYGGSCAKDDGTLKKECQYQFLDLICEAHQGKKPAGCSHTLAAVLV